MLYRTYKSPLSYPGGFRQVFGIAPQQYHDGTNWRDIERRATLFQLVNSLPEDQRSVIVKRFAEEKSIRDIAQEFGRSEGAIKQLQFRALLGRRRPVC